MHWNFKYPDFGDPFTFCEESWNLLDGWVQFSKNTHILCLTISTDTDKNRNTDSTPLLKYKQESTGSEMYKSKNEFLKSFIHNTFFDNSAKWLCMKKNHWSISEAKSQNINIRGQC